MSTNVLTVGPSQTIQEVVDGIYNASATNPYIIEVPPGTYKERVILKDFVSLQGAGRTLSIIAPVAAAATGSALTLGNYSRIVDMGIQSLDANMADGVNPYDCGYGISVPTGGVAGVRIENCDIRSDSQALTSLYVSTLKAVSDMKVYGCRIVGTKVGINLKGIFEVWDTTVEIDNTTGDNSHLTVGVTVGAASTLADFYRCAISSLNDDADYGAVGVLAGKTGSTIRLFGCNVVATDGQDEGAIGVDNGGVAGTITLVGGSVVATSSAGTAYDVKQATAGTVAAEMTYIASVSGTVTQVYCGAKVAHIADAAVQTLTGSDTVDISKVTADILSCKNAVNAVIAALESRGILATS